MQIAEVRKDWLCINFNVKICLLVISKLKLVRLSAIMDFILIQTTDNVIFTSSLILFKGKIFHELELKEILTCVP